MPQLQFEGLTDSLLRLPEVIKSIPDILREPAANPLPAAILLGMALVLVLIVLLTFLLIIVRPSPEDEEYYDEYEEEAEGGVAYGEGAEAVGAQAQPMSWLTVVSIIILVSAAVWVAAGLTTGGSDVCTSCHATTKHSAAKADDPHKGVACVKCHETGGPIARATVNLPVRAQHVILARNNSDLAMSYGRPVASDGCLQCHRSQIQGVYTNKEQGVRMSHKEPLAAGAQCVDCHVLISGVISSQTAGMTPCLRCHNGTITSADCKVCHVGDPGQAIRSTTATDAMAAAQVPNPECGGCHFDMTTCNNCHGIKMPHSLEFKAYAHAREGALDIWYNNGKQCAKCHYPGHNNCVQAGCHSFRVAGGHPNPEWAKIHQLTSWSNGPQTACSCHKWNPNDHAGMIYCQICHPTKPPNAIP